MPKYVVHLSFRASLLNSKELFLHLLEQNHRIEPSFFTNIMPVPAGKLLPQNEHFLGLGKSDLPKVFLVLGYLEIFLASLSVSLSIKMSWVLTGPLTLRVMMRPLSFPSKMRTLTCAISPVTLVRPMTCITSAGMSSCSVVVFSSLLIGLFPFSFVRFLWLFL